MKGPSTEHKSCQQDQNLMYLWPKVEKRGCEGERELGGRNAVVGEEERRRTEGWRYEVREGGEGRGEGRVE